MKLGISVSPASRSRLPRITAFALASSATRSSAACSRSRRTSSSSRWRCRAAPMTPAAFSSAASSEDSIARCWRVLSKPTTPMKSPPTKIGTIALVLVSRPSMAEQLSSEQTALLLKHTPRPARSSVNMVLKCGSLQNQVFASCRRAATPSAVHSLTVTSSGSPPGPVRVSITFTRSTCAASPMSPSTPGIAARTSSASSSMRLAFADAVSRRSRASSDSLIRVSSSVQGAWPSCRGARFAFIWGGTRASA